MGNYTCINDLFPEVYEMKPWCVPLRCPRIRCLSLCSVNVAKARRPRCFCAGLGTHVSPRRGMEHTEEAPDGAPSPGRQLLSFPLLPCNPGSLIRLRVPKCTQTLCLRSQSFSQILRTLKHRKCDSAGPQREKSLCSVWGTACWGLAGRETPKDREKQGWEGPACV